nr:hypothetical protein [Bacillota bacterium]
ITLPLRQYYASNFCPAKLCFQNTTHLQVVLELHAQGVNPTPRNVRVRLSKPNSFLETAAQMAHKNAIQELGLIKAE